MTSDYAIIPVREFSNSKLRLRNALTVEQRISLATVLLRRVAFALSRSKMSRAVIVATNPGEVNSLIRNSPKISIVEESTHHGGVTAAMNCGIEYAKNNGAATVTLLPSDLPFINGLAIDATLDALQRHELVINGSEKKDGTNLLSMHSSVAFALHFDDNSFVKHTLEARARNLDFLTVDFRELSLDLDDSGDLEKAMRLYGTSNFGTFLQKVTESGI